MFPIRSAQNRMPPALTDTPLPADPARLARHLSACQELIEIGMDMARQAAADMRQSRDPQTSAPDGPASPSNAPAHRIADPAARFERLARCVRFTILLEAHIAGRQAQATEAAERLASNRQAIAAMAKARLPAPQTPKPEATESVPREHFPLPASDTEIPSILSNISRELGIDLTDPTLAERLPKPLKPEIEPQPESKILPWLKPPPDD